MAMLAPVRTLLRHIDAMETLLNKGQDHVFTRHTYCTHSTVNTRAKGASCKVKLSNPNTFYLSFLENESINFTWWGQNQTEQKGKRKEKTLTGVSDVRLSGIPLPMAAACDGAKTHWLMNQNHLKSLYKGRWQVSSGKFQVGVAKPPTYPPTLMRTWSTQPTSPAVHQHSYSFLFFYLLLWLFIRLLLHSLEIRVYLFQSSHCFFHVGHNIPCFSLSIFYFLKLKSCKELVVGGFHAYFLLLIKSHISHEADPVPYSWHGHLHLLLTWQRVGIVFLKIVASKTKESKQQPLDKRSQVELECDW